MEQKTKILAENNKQELFVVREFDLPLDSLFKAFENPEIFEQWMGTKVIKLENKPLGNWRIETYVNGNLAFSAHGVIHEFLPKERITRTFQMENSDFPVQLEFFEFEALDSKRSKLVMQIIFKSVKYRDDMLKLPFAYGINMAHNKLETILLNI